MNKILLMSSLLLSLNIFAFDCSELVNLPDKKLDLVFELAHSQSMEVIDRSIESVSNKIKAERDLNLELLSCKKTISESKTELLFSNKLDEEEDLKIEPNKMSCETLAFFSSESIDLAINFIEASTTSTINENLKDLSKQIKATRDMKLSLLNCEKVASEKLTEELFKKLRGVEKQLSIDESDRNKNKDLKKPSNKNNLKPTFVKKS